MDDITRVCRKCGQEKPLEEFAKNKECALCYRHTCKQCDRERLRKWRAANPEKMRERTRKWRAANPEKAREYDRKRRAANPEKMRERFRKWYAANPDKMRECARKWRAANPDKVRECARKWRAANTEKEREIRRYKREILSDGYLRDLLKQRNLPITPETIDYKRIQLKLYREIKNQQNDERD